MRKRPSGPDLIAIADATETQAGGAATGYVAAMIRNARAIASRQEAAGDAPVTAELAALRALLIRDGGLPDLNRRLAGAIRAGTAPLGTHSHLLAVARAELAESNPKVLEKLDSRSPTAEPGTTL